MVKTNSNYAVNVAKRSNHSLPIWLGTIHIWQPWKLTNFQDPPPPLSTNIHNSSAPLTLDVQFQMNSLPQLPPPSQTHNLISRVIFKKLKTSFSPSSYSEKMCWGQGWAEASLSVFLGIYIPVCAVVQKYHRIIFIYNSSQF